MSGNDYPQEPQQGYYAQQPPPPNRKRTWLPWAIMGGAATLVVIVVAVMVWAMSGQDDGGTGGSAPGGATSTTAAPSPATTPTQDTAAVDELRSHMPPELRSAAECQRNDVASAAATITCQWTDSDVPMAAEYSSYTDIDSMNSDAQGQHQDAAQSTTCESADDFTAGGHASWRHGQLLGTFWCYLNEDKQPVILWTEDSLHILGIAVAPQLSDWERLLDWWEGAGPV